MALLQIPRSRIATSSGHTKLVCQAQLQPVMHTRRDSLVALCTTFTMASLLVVQSASAKKEAPEKGGKKELPKNMSRGDQLTALRAERKAALKEKAAAIKAGGTPTF